MAKEEEKPVAGDKGKGKAPAEDVNGAKEPQEKDKDGKKPVDVPSTSLCLPYNLTIHKHWTVELITYACYR